MKEMVVDSQTRLWVGEFCVPRVTTKSGENAGSGFPQYTLLPQARQRWPVYLFNSRRPSPTAGGDSHFEPLTQFR
jgi:hypothetical protein